MGLEQFHLEIGPAALRSNRDRRSLCSHRRRLTSLRLGDGMRDQPLLGGGEEFAQLVLDKGPQSMSDEHCRKPRIPRLFEALQEEPLNERLAEHLGLEIALL